ncbi:MAG: metallophosphoesterase [Candidatus Micrarchaeaceae archaeon]
MWLNEDIEILDGQAILHIKSLDALVCSDLHLGYEGVMAERGIFLPKANLSRIKHDIEKAVQKTNASKVIVAGDIKNEFSKVHLEEFNEFDEFVNFTKQIGISRLVLIKGNHDNFVDKYKEPFNIEIYRQETLFGKYLIFHGEKLPKASDCDFMIMGHAHPAIAVFNKIGVKEKIKCFLYGRLNNGKHIIVLPAMNFYAENVEMNIEDVSELSPVFGKLVNVNDLRAFCIGDGETLDFGKIGNLR